MTAQTADSVIIESVNNFQIKKRDQGHYQVTQFISYPSVADFTFFTQSLMLTGNFWDMFVYKLDKVKNTVSGYSYNHGTLAYNV